MSKRGHLIFVLAAIVVAPNLLPEDTNPDTAKSVDPLEGTERLRSQPATVKVAIAAPASAVTQTPTSAAEASSPSSETTVVTIMEPPTHRSIALHQPSIPKGRDAIGRQLQKELKRVGCYAGELNGAWTTSTRRAMRAFTDRVNAMLPTDEPDGILLALVQGHPDKICGTPCPARQVLSAAGQCFPYVILARTGGAKVATTPSEKRTSAWTTTTLADAALSPPTDASALVGATPPVTASSALKPAPRRSAERLSQPQARHEGNWVHNLFTNRH